MLVDHKNIKVGKYLMTEVLRTNEQITSGK